MEILETVPQVLLQVARERPNAVALRTINNEPAEYTFSQYLDKACRLATALKELGVQRGDRVVLLMRNRPEFHFVDMAVLLCGGTPISIYNSSSPEQISYVVQHSGAKLAVTEDDMFTERVLTGQSLEPSHVIQIEPSSTHAINPYAELIAREPCDPQQAAQIARPDDLVTVIYTSGTTGPPKGVMLDHANIMWTIDSLRTALGDEPFGWRVVSYLPMAHVAERMVTHYLGATLYWEVTTCPDPRKVADYLRPVKPHLLFAVPRIWEKAYARIVSMQDEDGLKRLDEAIDIGYQVSEYRARDEKPSSDLVAKYAEADASVLGLWRGLMGLDQLKVAVSGAAPLPFEMFRFFRGLGLPLSEIYGLSETCGPLTWTPFRVKANTVGPPIPGEEVKLAEDGEVCFRGGNMFRGYLNDSEKTSEAIDSEGWFHTGDIGEFDEDRYLKIVDRKKELIITAGGKNISPANLEAALKSHPLIGQACIIGESRPFIAALIVLDLEVARAWAARRGIKGADFVELSTDPNVNREVENAIDEVNRSFSHAEQVKKFVILDHDWHPDSEVLTPTMKLKRRGVNEKYAQLIENIYGA